MRELAARRGLAGSEEKRFVTNEERVESTPVARNETVGAIFAMHDSMADRRTTSISTKVTVPEYDAIARRAAPKTVSAWARRILVSTAQPDPLHILLLSEVMALRTIVLNLHYALAANHPLSEDAMRCLIDKADAEKFDKANERIASLHRAVDSTS